MKVYYEETYGGIYEVDDKIVHCGDDCLKNEMMDLFNIHNEMQGSRIVPLYGGEGGFQYQKMSEHIDEMSESEKAFYLWQLIRWYQGKLDEEMPDDRNTKEDVAMAYEVSRLKSAAKEMEDLLCIDLF